MLKKQNEKVIYIGAACEEIKWGWIQFPRLFAMKNGNIGLSIHDDDDAVISIGEDCKKWLISEDGGNGWRNATKEEVAMMGTVLPNGDVIRARTNAPISLKGIEFDHPAWMWASRTPDCGEMPQKSTNPKKMPFPLTVYGDIWKRHIAVYWMDTLPDQLQEKRFCFSRLRNGATESAIEHSDVDWTYRTAYVFPPSHAIRTDLEPAMIAGMGLSDPCIKVAPDGALYLADYFLHSADPKTGVYRGSTDAFIFRSTDNGKSWQQYGHIPYQPDEINDAFAYLRHGYDEPSIEFMPDGSMLCLLRTCDVDFGAPGWGPTYLSRSIDGGKTWSKPEYFQDRGALPHLLQLKNGVTLAVITRPGIYVYASRDCGKSWTERIEIMTDTDRSGLANHECDPPNFHEWQGSCCNTSIYPIADNKALLAFSDFYVSDGTGINKKGIKTVEIVVD
ncbi:MAG: exo-alpha-sialidase [Clostridia bacterium]|nr:exo-alpha-sialidase [Clostridia bacterium]